MIIITLMHFVFLLHFFIFFLHGEFTVFGSYILLLPLSFYLEKDQCHCNEQRMSIYTQASTVGLNLHSIAAMHPQPANSCDLSCWFPLTLVLSSCWCILFFIFFYFLRDDCSCGHTFLSLIIYIHIYM